MALRTELLNKETEPGMELGRAAGDVDQVKRPPPGKRKEIRHHGLGHLFLPQGGALQMTVGAAKVAGPPKVDLEGIDRLAPEPTGE